MKKIEEKYKILDQISHILLRPQTYVGSNKPNISIRYILDGNNFIKSEIIHIPSFLKIFDEVITNSVDAHKREPLKLNKIEVFTNKESRIIIKDNGGLPVEFHKIYKQYIPEVVFGNLMSGENYEDSDDRIVAGTNGLGAKLTNVFSKSFSVSTCDGKNQFDQVFTNNMRERTKPIIKKHTKGFTEISYLPDYEKFGLTELDESNFKMIEKRVIDIAGTNPSIKVYFNGKLIQIKSFEDYIKMYTTDYIYESNKDKSWSIGVSLSNDGFKQISFVNSVETYDGGSHVDYILNQILSKMREYFLKKHKVDVKPSELKNHIFLFLNSTIINSSFSSQTKEKLITEQKDFGYQFVISDKFISSILKSEIVQSILDWIDQKKAADENKLTRELNKNLSKIKVDKLIDAKGKDRWKCSLSLFEGDSASNPFRKYRDPQTQGAFSLKGKFINVMDINNQKLISNNEVINLMGAMGLKLGQKVVPGTLRYGKILFFCDADFDGNSIVGLLINFLYKYWPELFDHNMIYKVETPIVVSKHIKSKKSISVYSQIEYDEWLSKVNPKEWDISFKKGLSALLDIEYKEIINNPKMIKITSDELSSKYLNIWFGKDSESRKIEILK